jgi:hypothetical protein
VAIFFESSDEASGFIKGRDFLVKLGNCYIVKKGSAPWN